MKLLVHYVDFHPDNYQGGSGKSFQFTSLIEVPADLAASDFEKFVYANILRTTEKNRIFQGDKEASFCIQKIELFY